jgi:hypothetical protein
MVEHKQIFAFSQGPFQLAVHESLTGRFVHIRHRHALYGLQGPVVVPLGELARLWAVLEEAQLLAAENVEVFLIYSKATEKKHN